MPKRKKRNIVLVVDKEPLTYKILDIILDQSDFQVEQCPSGKQAIHLCVSLKPDIMLLELDLPDMKNEDIIATIRQWSQIPIIIVSSRTADEDVIGGLEMGADDYVCKPFNSGVLLARINAALRKSVVQEAGEPKLFNGPLCMDLMRHEVFLGEELIILTPKEYDLLKLFIRNCGKMMGHREILHEVWGPAHADNTQYLRVFVGQLRKKLERDSAMPSIITTELGVGYRMEFLQSPSRNKQGEFEL